MPYIEKYTILPSIDGKVPLAKRAGELTGNLWF